MRNRTVTLETIAGYELDMSLDDLMAKLTKIRESVPEEFRALIRTDYENGYDGASGSLDISYARPETQEEIAAREASERVRNEIRERGERAEFERLRKKFGPA